MSGVSAIIPAFEAEAWLRECLDSVLGQTVAPDEVIVVDDGSRDGTAAIAESYGDAVTLLRQENAGPGVATNTGIAAARGDILAFNDADDIWLPHKLERQLAVLEMRPEVDAVGGAMARFVCPSLDAETAARYVVPPEPERVYLGPVLLVRRSAFDRVGPYSGTLPKGGHHIDWIHRARQEGLVFAMVDEVLYRRRLHPGSAAHRTADFKHDILDMARRALARKRGENGGA